jgi:transposase
VSRAHLSLARVMAEDDRSRIGDRLVSTLDHTLEPKASSVSRLEVFTGTGRRRRFSDDDKARIVEETLAPGAVVSDVARRRGLSPQQLFTWRREARRRPVTPALEVAPVFVPALIQGKRSSAHTP